MAWFSAISFLMASNSLFDLTSFCWRLYLADRLPDRLDLAFQVAPLLLVGGQLVLGLDDDVRGGLDLLVDGVEAGGDGVEKGGEAGYFGVHILELDQLVESDIHN